MDKELSSFKADINLIEFAASCGYELIKRESSLSSASMRHANGDKVVISKSEGGDWVFFSVRNSQDNGTIIDFLQNRGGGSLGEARKTLRQFSGASVVLVAQDKKLFPDLVPSSTDRAAAVRYYEIARFAAGSAYLEGRGLSTSFLINEKFKGRFKFDSRQNVLFPHYDKAGLCGFEVKNKGFTGFSKGGIKGLWYSQTQKTDRVLIFTESAIDALSYHALNPDPFARYMSTGGSMNPQQPALIRAAMERMLSGSFVLIAFDNDEAGEKLAAEVKALAPSGLEVRRVLPSVGKDWNETLKNQLEIPDRPKRTLREPLAHDYVGK